MDKSQSTEDLQRAWIIQLSRDHLRVNREKKLNLETPNFAITESKRKVGHWCRQSKSIGISTHFIENHTWDVVTEVLKHEIAHQVVDERMKQPHAKAHGEEFQEACKRVGVHPQYRSAAGVIPKFMRPEGKTDSIIQKKIRKIEKLLALAESSNVHEASLAMERANKLITKYNIDRLHTKPDDLDYDYIRISTGKKKMDVWTKQIGAIIRNHFFCRMIITSSYDAKTNTHSRAMDLIGNQENLGMAKHVYDFLHDRLDTLWNKHRKETGAPGKQKRSFYMGTLQAFSQKMRENDQRDNAEILGNTSYKTTGALVLANDKVLQSFWENQYPSVRMQSAKTGRIHAGAYQSGQEEGKRLTIHKPVEHSAGNQGLVIGLRKDTAMSNTPFQSTSNILEHHQCQSFTDVCETLFGDKYPSHINDWDDIEDYADLNSAERDSLNDIRDQHEVRFGM